nr:hypothetical protein MACL_00000646 [Theileria orientalis]
MASKINFQEALNLFTIDGRATLTPQQAANFSSLFAPTSEDEVLPQVGNSQKMNTTRNETMSKNTLYHILKNSNRLTISQFNDFLDDLGMNTDQINIKQFVDKLTNMYQ